MRRAILAAAALIVCGTAVASAQDVKRGEALSERWCVTCHIVAPNAQGGDAGPSFQSVANRENQTEGGITAWLFEPHPPMPDLKLSPAEFRDIAAYIMSLRK